MTVSDRKTPTFSRAAAFNALKHMLDFEQTVTRYG